jgi:hypothetical protein
MTSQTQSVFFIDARVADIENLTMQLPSGSEWFLISGDSHGLFQIQQALANRTNLDAIHLITHGSPGSVSLGNGVLNEGNINEFKQQLESLGKSLKPTGDLLIYGCDVGSGQAGQQFIERVAKLTAADVAASNDKTGSSLLGGDWELEATYGVVKEQPDNFQNYEQLLVTEDNTVATNSGTLFNGDDGDNNIQGTLFDDTLLTPIQY